MEMLSWSLYIPMEYSWSCPPTYTSEAYELLTNTDKSATLHTLRRSGFFMFKTSLLVCVRNITVSSKHAEQRLFILGELCRKTERTSNAKLAVKSFM